jgi:hypothetical protein
VLVDQRKILYHQFQELQLKLLLLNQLPLQLLPCQLLVQPVRHVLVEITNVLKIYRTSQHSSPKNQNQA